MTSIFHKGQVVFWMKFDFSWIWMICLTTSEQLLWMATNLLEAPEYLKLLKRLVKRFKINYCPCGLRHIWNAFRMKVTYQVYALFVVLVVIYKLRLYGLSLSVIFTVVKRYTYFRENLPKFVKHLLKHFLLIYVSCFVVIVCIIVETWAVFKGHSITYKSGANESGGPSQYSGSSVVGMVPGASEKSRKNRIRTLEKVKSLKFCIKIIWSQCSGTCSTARTDSLYLREYFLAEVLRF